MWYKTQPLKTAFSSCTRQWHDGVLAFIQVKDERFDVTSVQSFLPSHCTQRYFLFMCYCWMMHKVLTVPSPSNKVNIGQSIYMNQDKQWLEHWTLRRVLDYRCILPLLCIHHNTFFSERIRKDVIRLSNLLPFSHKFCIRGKRGKNAATLLLAWLNICNKLCVFSHVYSVISNLVMIAVTGKNPQWDCKRRWLAWKHFMTTKWIWSSKSLDNKLSTGVRGCSCEKVYVQEHVLIYSTKWDISRLSFIS